MSCCYLGKFCPELRGLWTKLWMLWASCNTSKKFHNSEWNKSFSNSNIYCSYKKSTFYFNLCSQQLRHWGCHAGKGWRSKHVGIAWICSFVLISRKKMFIYSNRAMFWRTSQWNQKYWLGSRGEYKMQGAEVTNIHSSWHWKMVRCWFWGFYHYSTHLRCRLVLHRLRGNFLYCLFMFPPRLFFLLAVKQAEAVKWEK